LFFSRTNIDRVYELYFDNHSGILSLVTSDVSELITLDKAN